MTGGCITKYAVGAIVKINGKMIKINLLIAVDMIRLRENRIIFPQDSDLKHSSK